MPPPRSMPSSPAMASTSTSASCCLACSSVTGLVPPHSSLHVHCTDVAGEWLVPPCKRRTARGSPRARQGGCCAPRPGGGTAPAVVGSGRFGRRDRRRRRRGGPPPPGSPSEALDPRVAAASSSRVGDGVQPEPGARHPPEFGQPEDVGSARLHLRRRGVTHHEVGEGGVQQRHRSIEIVALQDLRQLPRWVVGLRPFGG